MLGALPLLSPWVRCARAQSPLEKGIDASDGIRLCVKMIGPVTEKTDLQIICILMHNPDGDKYIEAMKDFNDKLGGILSTLRDRGEFAGDPGETLLFTPPPNSVAPARVLLIGVGNEADLSLNELRLVGRIAAREAARLDVAHVAFAPTLRDQGSSRIDVGQGDGAMVEQFLLAYDTEKRLESESLAPKDSMVDLTIEAGPKYFDAAVENISAAAASADAQIKRRVAAPYLTVQAGN
jgi:hypothetical protein